MTVHYTSARGYAKSNYICTNALMAAARDLALCMSFSFQNFFPAQATGRGICALHGCDGRKKAKTSQKKTPIRTLGEHSTTTFKISATTTFNCSMLTER